MAAIILALPATPEEAMVRGILKKDDHTTFEARTVGETWEILARSDIACCVLDLSLPGGDVVDLVLRLRKSPHANAHMPVICVGYMPDLTTITRARLAGVNSVVVRPASPRDIVDRLYRILRLKPEATDGDGVVSI